MILIEFRDKFREYYGMDIKTYDRIMDSVKYVLQGYSDSENVKKQNRNLTVALRYVLDMVVRPKVNYICSLTLYVPCIILQCVYKPTRRTDYCE